MSWLEERVKKRWLEDSSKGGWLKEQIKNCWLDRQVKNCIKDHAKFAFPVPGNDERFYCGLYNARDNNKCDYAGDIKVFDIGLFGTRRFKEFYECLYTEKVLK